MPATQKRFENEARLMIRSCFRFESQTFRRSANRPEKTSDVPSNIRLTSAEPGHDRIQLAGLHGLAGDPDGQIKSPGRTPGRAANERLR